MFDEHFVHLTGMVGLLRSLYEYAEGTRAFSMMLGVLSAVCVILLFHMVSAARQGRSTNLLSRLGRRVRIMGKRKREIFLRDLYEEKIDDFLDDLFLKGKITEEEKAEALRVFARRMEMRGLIPQKDFNTVKRGINHRLKGFDENGKEAYAPVPLPDKGGAGKKKLTLVGSSR